MARRLNIATLKILIFAGIAVGAIFVLAVGLSNLELLPGNLALLEYLLQQLLARLFFEDMQEYATPTGGGQVLILILRIVYTFVLVGLPFAIVYFIISAEFRKRVIKLTSFLAIIMGYALSGLWLGIVLIIILGVLWLFAIKQNRDWPASGFLVCFVGVAVGGIHMNAGAGWMLLGVIAALSAWDLHHFFSPISTCAKE